MPPGLLNSGWLFTFQTAGSYSDTPEWATHIKLHMYVFVSLVAKFTSASYLHQCQSIHITWRRLMRLSHCYRHLEVTHSMSVFCLSTNMLSWPCCTTCSWRLAQPGHCKIL